MELVKVPTMIFEELLSMESLKANFKLNYPKRSRFTAMFGQKTARARWFLICSLHFLLDCDYECDLKTEVFCKILVIIVIIISITA